MSLQSLLLLCFCAGALAGPLDFFGGNVWSSTPVTPKPSVLGSRAVAGATSVKNEQGRWLSGVLDKVVDGGKNVVGTVGAVVDGGVGVVGTIVNGTKDVSGTLINGVKDTVGSVLEGDVSGTVGNLMNMTYKVLDRTSVQAANTGADLLVAQFKTVATALGVGDRVPLPSFSAPIVAGTTLSASDGYFSSPMRIMRPADVVLSRSGLTTLTIDVPMQIKDLIVAYDKYTISTWLGDTSGKIMVKVADNLIKIRLKITISVTCMVNLERVELTDMKGIEVDLTSDCNYCGYITSKATNYVVGLVEGTIRAQIQAQIDAILKSALSNDKMPICSKLIGL